MLKNKNQNLLNFSNFILSMPKTISKDSPLSELIIRRYEKPYSTNRRDLARKLCLSIGLLQPGDSRDVIVDILLVLMDAKDKKQFLESETIRDYVVALRKKNNLPQKGIACSNIRRQLKRLRDLFIAEKVKNQYRITEFEDLNFIFKEKIEKYYLPSIMQRVEEYFNTLK